MSATAHILLISGSLRAGSTNQAVLKTAAELVPSGLSTHLFEGMAALPHFNPDDDAEDRPMHPAVVRLRHAVNAADALLLCTPEYAGALPGALKNLLEWTVGDGSTYQKPIAWINAAGPAAPTAAADAHESLRKVLRYVHATIVEDACVRIPITRSDVDADGTIADRGRRAQISEVLETLGTAVRSRASGDVRS